MRHFAINAATFSISTLVLQKQHRLKHKRRFSQVHKHKIRSKPFYTNFKLGHVVEKYTSHDMPACRKYHWL